MFSLDAHGHYARPLTRTYDICPAIRYFLLMMSHMCKVTRSISFQSTHVYQTHAKIQATVLHPEMVITAHAQAHISVVSVKEVNKLYISTCILLDR